MPRGFKSLTSPVIDTFASTRFLAKVVHGFAHHAAGLGFDPLLKDFILRGPAAVQECTVYVGGESDELPAASAALHEMSAGWEQVAGTDHLVVRLRLFANLGAQRYVVVAGRRRSTSTAAIKVNT